MAVLEPQAAARAAHWPALVEAITDRGMRRSRSLAVWAAIEAIRGIDKRLWVLFWHLAEHWGEVEPDGAIVVPLNLTHETLSILVGARRPSVSTALSRLASAGRLKRVPGRGWRLRGEPPPPRE
jgi:CRP-like cAMP-binding protein